MIKMILILLQIQIIVYGSFNKNKTKFLFLFSPFKLADITTILKYKSRKDVIRDMIDTKYRKHLRDINTNQEVNRTQENKTKFLFLLNEPWFI